ncbi:MULTISPECIES: pyridoxal phosphate-dependent aminotransferase [unclassified Paracoccus (in: a-proteobacteria)]|uniref:pyridoxal phosphate-dependent aminotransferase n=1 Tax=unclassified Paracoccus (in: a-proteobacteria) TaxID=2688777 RepID=UPI0012B27F00|nr:MULTISPECIES: pyridoxal phosphate-dependent aminotransferase [unclassified Paracoccus (in: a-proteobacteria)]UXU75416.1 pyridoxal phosphate-dependent aminotransferase [Paracoccus sp. SMMA_5]UXU81322.1 pyridoxal phosphate-dependent aminotransferase [Paracoccus sp. SMMA_5_TC]
MSRFRFAPIAAALPATVPFTGPETLERQGGIRFRARLGANENGFGPSPRAVEAMARAAAEVWKYGDPDNHDLRHALAEHHGVAPENIILGEGIDGLLGLLVRLMLAPGEVVVTSDGAYPTFNYHVAGFGGRLVKVPYRDDAEDPEALVAAARQHRARLVYLANPDNPMGSWHAGARILAMLEAMPADSLLVLDEAYGEFSPEAALPRIDPEDARVIRFRTFSKAYALAGARIGYAIGPAELIAGFDRIRNHFGVNRIAQAGALAALGDRDWLAHLRDQVALARQRLSAIGAEHGLVALPSATNFVALDTGRDGDFARALLQELGRAGVFVRMPGVAPMNRCIRVSCGPEAELDAFAQALPGALRALGG